VSNAKKLLFEVMKVNPKDVAQDLAVLLVLMQLELMQFEIRESIPTGRRDKGSLGRPHNVNAMRQQAALLARVQQRLANPSLEVN
jgi:hypothetical protein